MMNHPSASVGESDNTYDQADQNSNRVTTITEFSEEYTSNMLFDGYNDNDDEVFEEYQESTVTITREPRVRRISDVIDSIGCSPSSPISKNSGNFDFNEKSVSEVEGRSISIVRREEVQYINLHTPPQGRARASVTDSFLSPPTTPSSDQGYCTPPPSQLVYRPKWFRYSASSCEPSSPPRLDTMDAQVLCAPTEQQEQQPMESSSPLSESAMKGVTPLVYPKAPMPVSLSSFEYNMGHSHTGHAVIFNHETFTMDNTPQRNGSKLDANKLEETLMSLGFTCTVYHDLSSEKIKARINELASMDHSDCDCVLIAVLSHGMGTSYILSYDYPYPVDMLWSPFTADRCPSLAGKPKLFLIQACRGDKLDGGVQLVKRTQTQVDSDCGSYKIPAMADFLFAYSTAEGFYSWRNPLKGTWFIQSLCQILEKEAYNHDLHTLLLMVSHKVALEHESFSDLYPWQHQQKQVPQMVSTLIRKIQFQKKP